MSGQNAANSLSGWNLTIPLVANSTKSRVRIFKEAKFPNRNPLNGQRPLSELLNWVSNRGANWALPDCQKNQVELRTVSNLSIIVRTGTSEDANISRQNGWLVRRILYMCVYNVRRRSDAGLKTLVWRRRCCVQLSSTYRRCASPVWPLVHEERCNLERRSYAESEQRSKLERLVLRVDTLSHCSPFLSASLSLLKFEVRFKTIFGCTCC